MTVVPLAVSAIGIAAQLTSDRAWGAEPTVALLVAVLCCIDLVRSALVRRRRRLSRQKEDSHDGR
jgi:hypothetical protein